MKMHLLLIVFLSPAGPVFSGDLLSAIKDVPPMIGIAEVTAPDPRDRSEMQRIALSIPKIHWQIVGEVVPMKQWPELKAEAELDVLTLQLGGPSALSPSRVVDLSGKELKPGEWSKRLGKETPVFVSVSGKMPDPYFLQLAKPDALIIILGPRDGSPAPEFLPREGAGPATRKTAEQGADQPATSPESKPEGDENPEPESEGRPR